MNEFNFDEFKERNSAIFDGKSQKEIEEMRKVLEPFGTFMGALFDMNNKKKMEVKRVGTVKNITAEMGEDCNVDVDILHDTLSKLPAEMYLKLYHKMQEKVLGYPPFYNGCYPAAIAENVGE